MSKKIKIHNATNSADVYDADAVDEKISWKLVSAVTGSTLVKLPNKWNEILIVSSVTGDTYKGLTCIIPANAPKNMHYRLSYYGAANDNANVGYYLGNDNDIKLAFYQLNGGSPISDISTVQTKIFYR